MGYIRGHITVVRVFLPTPEGKFMVVQRSKNSDYNDELWELPGGKLKTAEENPSGFPEDHIEGAKDRILKGTGFIISMSDELVVIERRTMRDPIRKGQLYVSLIGNGEIIGGELNLSSKYQAAENLDIAPLPPYEFTTDTIGAVAIKNQGLYHH